MYLKSSFIENQVLKDQIVFIAERRKRTFMATKTFQVHLNRSIMRHPNTLMIQCFDGKVE